MDWSVIQVGFFMLVPFTMAFGFFVFIFYRSKRESMFRQKEMEFNREIAEVEMKALRAQLNPHFIFNCLNSIYRFLDLNQSKEAGEYLTKFSNLMRTVLENSTHREISLKDDLYALELYIELEQLRMNFRFNYDLRIEGEIDIEKTLIPPLIAQPFVENSIWHGLNNRTDKGQLTISLKKKNGMLSYCVQDNGIKSEVVSSSGLSGISKKSLGMTLIKERLEILNRFKSTEANFHVEDILDDQKRYLGKRVELMLPLEVD